MWLKKVRRIVSFPFVFIAFSFSLLFMVVSSYKSINIQEDIDYEKAEAAVEKLVKVIKSTDEIEDIKQADFIRLYADGKYGWEIKGATLERRLFLIGLICDYLQQYKKELDNNPDENYSKYYIDFYQSKIYLLEQIAEANSNDENNQKVVDEILAFIRFVEKNTPDKFYENSGYIEEVSYRLLEEMGKKSQAYQLMRDYYAKIRFFKLPEIAEDNEFIDWLKKQPHPTAKETAEQNAKRQAFFTEQKQKLVTQTSSEVVTLTPENYKQIVTNLELVERFVTRSNSDAYYVKGDVYIDGDFNEKALRNLFGNNNSRRMPLYLIDGNLVVNGVIDDSVIDGLLSISGSMVAQIILHEDSSFNIEGDLIANEMIYGYYNHGWIEVTGKTQSPLIYSYDHAMPSDNAFYSAHFNPNSAVMGFADKVLGELLNMHPLLFTFDNIKEQVKQGMPIVKPQYQLSEVKKLPVVDMDY